MRSALLLLAAVLAASPFPARADAKSDLAAIEAQLKACLASDESNNGMKQCYGAAEDSDDALLNKNYKMIVANLRQPSGDAGEASDNAEMLKRLIASERAWVAYRQSQCELQSVEMLGGSGEGLIILSCLHSMTSERVQALDDLFKDFIGK